MPLPASYRPVLLLDDRSRQPIRLARGFHLALPRRAVFVLAFVLLAVRAAAAQEAAPTSTATQTTVRLEAEQQRKEGDIYFADGKVEIQYKDFTLRADHVEYNSKTYAATATGHVVFDVATQHI